MDYKIGDIITGTVTGIQSYGIFVALDMNIQGLIHISECKHGYVTDLDEMIQVNDEVVAKIIDIDEYTKKISLSLRAMEKLPIPPYPQRKKHRRRRYTPQIGFETLREKMPTWIEEAKLDEKKRISNMNDI
ncbi:CvfD/Ygs/GSP13 family RNA-binding post-transcriptional regulator [Jeotgalibaca ciconiae]|uniref:S1 RNA-binding domain-containing protein n=1 Tax=Jeotgalibaca ciconiae TaxID=2496265 RepID=A0A3Q9BMN3_9LACT|nr:CvfD/Ygs/GSP13 family RNA-binding post-transcriptional regulator [Jeotgalibaca ciconiae]AZP05547.1 S1 RNA-binding domain-containing protein [Jeotgalibaca ciconiae]HJB24396.1 S1 RNA-binding domain-containing protein [Candidatus Jeotgalibaca pullicola]